MTILTAVPLDKMNPAYSVILFTTASGAGYGLLALLGLVGFNHGQASSPAFALTTTFIALALITTGLLSSTLHLGHPERAWRALSQWRSSWLSREGVAAVATYPVAIAFAASWSGLISAPALIKPLGILTLVMCTVTVICTAMIYRSLRTIRQWNHKLVVPVYLALALASGAALLPAIAVFFGRWQIFQAALATLSIIIAIALKLAYWHLIDRVPRTHTTGEATGLGENVRMWELPHTNQNFIQKEMGFVVARKHAKKLRMATILLLALAAFLSACTSISPWLAPIAVPPLAIALWIERWLFFAEAEHVVNLYYGRAAV
jgi:sulfite dehydrogenase (quinone) subunit SoeC